ncbi:MULTISPECIES: glycoside hydrolase family 20 zincin-like fold domain-containing protein [unclassified Streptomyces]|uniref:glycoside hydrolase family 20 zincin-like fold domain-containing protein n=1 Tax=unclassified Streptomyces TaxID=2593676 RepID=UPI001EEF82B5|nr:MULTISPECIES: glycoside hydrolase family 20 zincin-like fold domain-containing protein [unclassified Streptomyces]
MDMRKARRRTIGAVVAALAATLLPWQTAAADEAPAAPPEVLPTLRQWQPGSGEFVLTDRARIVLDGVRERRTADDAARFAGELAGKAQVSRGRARAGDIVLRQDASLKGSLGAEGYRLEVGDRVTVTAATSAGVFYGSRTVLQLLDDDGRAARGSATDVPAYRERGVGVCACYINVSLPWFERLMKDMASQKRSCRSASSPRPPGAARSPVPRTPASRPWPAASGTPPAGRTPTASRWPTAPTG